LVFALKAFKLLDELVDLLISLHKIIDLFLEDIVVLVDFKDVFLSNFTLVLLVSLLEITLIDFVRGAVGTIMIGHGLFKLLEIGRVFVARVVYTRWCIPNRTLGREEIFREDLGWKDLDTIGLLDHRLF
jgi:hypothetical protein